MNSIHYATCSAHPTLKNYGSVTPGLIILASYYGFNQEVFAKDKQEAVDIIANFAVYMKRFIIYVHEIFYTWNLREMGAHDYEIAFKCRSENSSMIFFYIQAMS